MPSEPTDSEDLTDDEDEEEEDFFDISTFERTFESLGEAARAAVLRAGLKPTDDAVVDWIKAKLKRVGVTVGTTMVRLTLLILFDGIDFELRLQLKASYRYFLDRAVKAQNQVNAKRLIPANRPLFKYFFGLIQRLYSDAKTPTRRKRRTCLDYADAYSVSSNEIPRDQIEMERRTASNVVLTFCRRFLFWIR